MQFARPRRFLTPSMVIALGTALTLGCGNDDPTAPEQASPTPVAATPGPVSAKITTLFIETGHLRLRCSVGSVCQGQVTAESPGYTISYTLTGAGWSIANTTCPNPGPLSGVCVMTVQVPTSTPGNYRGAVTFTETSTGTTKTVRLAASVS
jgi:hypothetical protein